MQQLIKADRIVKEMLGLIAPAQTQTKKGDAPTIPVAKRKPPAVIPEDKTLGSLPVAQGNDTGGPWAALDKLSGEALEAALERLTPEQRKRYERSS